MSESLIERIRESGDKLDASHQDMVVEVLTSYDLGDVRKLRELVGAFNEWENRNGLRPDEALEHAETPIFGWCQFADFIKKGFPPSQAQMKAAILDDQTVTGPIAKWYIDSIGL